MQFISIALPIALTLVTVALLVMVVANRRLLRAHLRRSAAEAEATDELVATLRENAAAQTARADAATGLSEALQRKLEATERIAASTQELADGRLETIRLLQEVDQERQTMIGILKEQLGIAEAQGAAASRSTRH